MFPWYGHNPVRGAIFDGAMTDFSRVETQGFLTAYDCSGLTHLIDVGGGRGQLLQTVLRQHGHLRGTLFDQPAVVEPVAVPPTWRGASGSPRVISLRTCRPAATPTCSSTSSTTGAMRPASRSWATSGGASPPAAGC